MTKNITEKLTFAEMQANQDAVLNNSNLANLATAIMNIKAERQAIVKRLKALTKLEEDINNMASSIEKGEYFEVTEVANLYKQAQNYNSRSL